MFYTFVTREDDLQVSISKGSEGFKYIWDEGKIPTPEEEVEAATRAQEVEDANAALNEWPESRVMSLLIRYVLWLIINVPTARPPAGRLRNELRRFIQKYGTDIGVG